MSCAAEYNEKEKRKARKRCAMPKTSIPAARTECDGERLRLARLTSSWHVGLSPGTASLYLAGIHRARAVISSGSGSHGPFTPSGSTAEASGFADFFGALSLASSRLPSWSASGASVAPVAGSPAQRATPQEEAQRAMICLRARRWARRSALCSMVAGQGATCCPHERAGEDSC